MIDRKLHPILVTLSFLALALSITGCGGDAETSDADPAPASVRVVPTRAAIPELFDIMMDLQSEMARIDRGLWSGRLDTIAVGAEEIAAHRRVSADEQRVLRGILGDDVIGFNRQDDRLHERAELLEAAAATGDMEAVLEAYTSLRAGCVRCHGTYRERLRAGVR